MLKANRWIEEKSNLLSGWASILGIIAFPTIVATAIIGYFQLKDYLEKPDLHLEFSNPKAVAFTIVNTNDVLAEKPLYWFGIFDIDSQPLNTIPVPAKEISYLRGNSKQGPNALGSVYAKKGHRYFGFAGIHCKNCEETRRYWIYFVHGSKSGAWYREMKINETQIINAIKLQADAERYLAEILPKTERIQIK